MNLQDLSSQLELIRQNASEHLNRSNRVRNDFTWISRESYTSSNISRSDSTDEQPRKRKKIVSNIHSKDDLRKQLIQILTEKELKTEYTKKICQNIAPKIDLAFKEFSQIVNRSAEESQASGVPF